MAKDYQFIKQSGEGHHKSMQQCARHMFGIAVNCVQEMEAIKDVKEADLNDLIVSYKNQIGKYNKIIMSEEWNDNTKTVNQAVLQEHKKALLKAKEANKEEDIVEALLSLRLYGLDMKTNELRANFINEMVANDLLYIKEKNNVFVMSLLEIELYSLKQTTISIISILASTEKGADYITSQGYEIVEFIIKVKIFLF
jgi:hypothetical protein